MSEPPLHIPRTPLTPQPFHLSHLQRHSPVSAGSHHTSGADWDRAIQPQHGEGHELLDKSGGTTSRQQYDTMAPHAAPSSLPPKRPRRSMSAPGRPSDLLKAKHGRHHAHVERLPLTPLDPERNVKRAAAQQFAKSTFFHGSFTSSHGAMMLRYTPTKLGPPTPQGNLDQQRARQMALMLMPPAMRQRYLQNEGTIPHAKPPRLVIPRPTDARRAASLERKLGVPSHTSFVPPPLARRESPSPARVGSVQDQRDSSSFALPPPVPDVRRRSATSAAAATSHDGARPKPIPQTASKGKLSELEEIPMDEDERTEPVEEIGDELVSWTDALVELLPLAIPSSISLAVTSALNTIPLAFVGTHMGEEKLAGASIGMFIIYTSAQYPIVGLTFALDTLVSHEYGRNPQSDVLGVLLQRSILINLAFCLPICVLLYNIEAVLVNIYSPAMARDAAAFLFYAPLYLVPAVCSVAFSKFCSNQMLPQVPMIALICGLIATPISQHWLIHLGVEGAMLGMAAVAWTQLFIVIGLTLAKKETRLTLGSIRLGEALDWEDVVVYLKLALPSALFVAAEASAFDVTVLLAASLGEAEGAAWSALLSSLIPFVSVAGGLGTAACAKVGASLGGGYPFDARRYAIVAVVTAAACAVVNSMIVVTFLEFLLNLFGAVGPALVVGKTLAQIIPVLHIADSIQFAFQGVFSGAGQNHRGALILLCSLWAIGIPAACVLAFHFGMGVRGIVTGLTIGLVAECPLMIYTALTLNWQKLSEEAQQEALEEEEDEEGDEEDGEEGDEEEEDEEEMEEFDNSPALSSATDQRPPSSRRSSRRGRSTTPKIIR